MTISDTSCNCFVVAVIIAKAGRLPDDARAQLAGKQAGKPALH